MVKSGLHIVVTIAEHACDHVLKRVLKLLIYRVQYVLWNMNTCDHYNYVKTNAYLESLKTCSQPCACDPYDLYEDQA